MASFVVLAEELHYGRAASRQHITSSAMTKRIQRLEHQVGRVLLERGPTGTLDLTAAGRRFAGQARPLLLQAQAAREAARAAPAARLTLRLGVPGELGCYPTRHQLAEVGRRLRASHPDVRLLYHGLPFSRLVTAVCDGTVDVVLGVSPQEHADLTLTPLDDLRRTGVVPRHHELAEAGGVSVELFASLPLLFDPAVPEGWMSWWYLGDVRPRAAAQLVPIQAPGSLAVLHQVEVGAGVTTTVGAVASRLGARLRPVTLLGSPPAVYYGARLRRDRREPVLALLRSLKSLRS